MIQLSVVVMTYNEAANIGRCLGSVQDLADEIVVVDSHSTDETAAIAEQLGARVILRPFQGFTDQRSFSIRSASCDHVLVLDADEALSEELRASVRAAKAGWAYDCYWCNRLSSFGGRWIRHGAWYPDRKMRLFDRRKYRVGGIDPHDEILPVPGAREGHLRGDLLHYTNEDIAHRIDKVNGLSTAAANAYAERGRRGSLLRVLFKPPIRFLVEYIIRRGFLDGYYGFVIARSSALYVFLREAKLLEKQWEG